MKVLFVSSSNKKACISPIVVHQAESLEKAGVSVKHFLIKGKGICGYLKNLHTLRKQIFDSHYDLIHAHGISSLLATLSFQKPLIVSLLGSELNESKLFKAIIRNLAKYYWAHTIVKSEDMAIKINITNKSKISIIPNGVNLDLFKPKNKLRAKEEINWSTRNEKIILFLADRTRTSKNFKLAERAFKIMGTSNVKLVDICNIPVKEMPFYLNASDVILLTSLWEGSPNTIKEAMACNRPVVATAVGDISWLFGNEPGYYVTSFEPSNVADKIREALSFSEKFGKTNGRNRLLELGLDSESISRRIVKVYEQVAG